MDYENAYGAPNMDISAYIELPSVMQYLYLGDLLENKRKLTGNFIDNIHQNPPDWFRSPSNRDKDLSSSKKRSFLLKGL